MPACDVCPKPAPGLQCPRTAVRRAASDQGENHGAIAPVDIHFDRRFFMSSTYGGSTPGIGTQRPEIRFDGNTQNDEKREGPVAKTIEDRTSRLPSDLFLWAALGSMAVSAFLHVSHRREDGMFVGQWAPSFLILGLYNKLVKVAGSDAQELEQRTR